MVANVKTIVYIGGLAASVIGGGFATVKTAAPYFQTPPPFSNEDQVAQALQAVQKGQALANDRMTRMEHRQTKTDLRVNAAEMSSAAADLGAIQTEVKLRPKDAILQRLLSNAQQRLSDLQAEHDALRSEK